MRILRAVDTKSQGLARDPTCSLGASLLPPLTWNFSVSFHVLMNMRTLSHSLLPVATGLLLFGTASAQAQRTYASREFPVYPNGGKPDLAIDGKRVQNQMQIIDRLFEPTECAVIEGAVGGPGVRRLLRFDTVILNSGDGDLIVGNRADPENPYADWFYYEACHGHYHLFGFADYSLLNKNGVVAVGRKQGFCMEDSFKYDGGKSNGYNCEYQGITSGWGDWYYKQLDGQWVDITGIPAGDYILRVTVDAADIFDEGDDRYPNFVDVPVRIPDPRNKVAVEP